MQIVKLAGPGLYAMSPVRTIKANVSARYVGSANDCRQTGYRLSESTVDRQCFSKLAIWAGQSVLSQEYLNHNMKLKNLTSLSENFKMNFLNQECLSYKCTGLTLTLRSA